MRDFPRVCAPIKAHTLMNADYRTRNEHGDLMATKENVDTGFELYDMIREPNDLGLSPATYEMCERAIKPILSGLNLTTNQDIQERSYAKFRRFLDDSRVSFIISQLETAGLIRVDRSTRPHQYFAPPDEPSETGDGDTLGPSGSTGEDPA